MGQDKLCRDLANKHKEHPKMNYRDRYKQRVNSFYNFRITEDKYSSLEKMTTQQRWKTFRKGLIWGVLFEILIIATPICTFGAN